MTVPTSGAALTQDDSQAKPGPFRLKTCRTRTAKLLPPA